MKSPIQLLSFLMCDGVHVDPMTGKQTILGVFASLRAPRFPLVVPRMFWYLSVMDVPVGKHELKVSLGLPVEEPREVIRREFESKSPAHRINMIHELRKLQFDRPGDYTISIDVDDDELLVTSINIGA